MRFLPENRLAEAVVSFRSALAIAPDNHLIWNNLALALHRADLSDEAAACLELALGLVRVQPDTWLLLGIIRKKLGNAPGAEAAYRVALEQDPRSALAWQCLGEIKQEQREYPAAIDCFVACAQCGGMTGPILATLGSLYFLTGRIADAHEAYLGALQFDAGNQHYRRVLGRVRFACDLIQGQSVEDALATFCRSISDASQNADAAVVKLLRGTFGLFSAWGPPDTAIRVGRKLLEFCPNSTSIKYLLRALAGEPGLDRSPAEYIVENFDAFAEGFDAQLVQVLGYDVPAKIVARLREWVEPDRRYDVLDAGCGTGLCGPLLRKLARKLTGVDLSAKMLEQAARRGCYDVLTRQDLTTLMEDLPNRFDLVAATDVLIYLGDLVPFFAAAARAVRPGGLLAVSTERRDAGGYQLLKSGRFAHAAEYVRASAGSAFVQCDCVGTTIRLENTTRVPGDLFVFRRA